MINGKFVQISQVTAGQTIDSVEEHEGTFVCRDIAFESGNTISVVDSHRFMLDSGQWIAAQNLNSSHRLKTLTGTVGIKRITMRSYTGKVYNLKIKNSEQYLVGKDTVIGLPDRIEIVPAMVVKRRSCAAEHEAACFMDDSQMVRVLELPARPILSYFSCKVCKLLYTHTI